MFSLVDSSPGKLMWGALMNWCRIATMSILAMSLAACSDESGSKKPSVEPVEKSAVSEPGQEGVTAGSPAVAAHAARASTQAAASHMCVGDCRRSGILEARSQEEAEWLVRHRYPTAAEVERMRVQSLAALQQNAQAGDTTAAVLLGKRIALEKNFLDGQVMLREQALSGNLYAFYAIAETYRESGTPNLVDSAAYLRLAYILGDHKAANEIGKLGLTSVELSAADSRASQLYKGFAGDRVPDPRPQE